MAWWKAVTTWWGDEETAEDAQMAERVDAQLQRMASRMDPMLCSDGDWQSQLRAPLAKALACTARLVSHLPGPLAVDRQAFAQEPLVHALFASADDVRKMLGQSEVVREYLDSGEGMLESHFYGVLVARRQQKKQFGMVEVAGIVHRDVAQEVLYFRDHLLILPSPELDKVHDRLQEQIIDSFVATFQHKLDALRDEKDRLRIAVGLEQSQLLQWKLHESQAPDAVEQASHQADLAAAEEKLQNLLAQLTPEKQLQAFAEHLNHAESLLAAEEIQITVNRMGVVCKPQTNTEDDSRVAGQNFTLNFPELTGRDGQRYIGVLVRVSRQEAVDAVAQVSAKQRRYLFV